MAITQPVSIYMPDPDVRFESVDHIIQGKMVVCTMTMPGMSVSNMASADVDYIRQTLVNKIGEFLIDNKLVEYTQARDPISFDNVVRARVFCTPDDTVRLIRTLKR
jgi:hypothetical protein